MILENVVNKEKMSGLIENIRSQLESVLSQWNQNEKEYLVMIEELKQENTNLKVLVADMRQEIEFLTKQFDGSQANEKKLTLELEQLKFTNNTKKRWRFFN